MSASIHSQASSRPQSTVSGIPVVASTLQQNDQASVSMSHHTSEAHRMQQLQPMEYLHTGAEDLPECVGAGFSERAMDANSLAGEQQPAATTTVQSTTYGGAAHDSVARIGEAVPLMGAVVTNRAVEVDRVVEVTATPPMTAAHITTTYNTVPVAATNIAAVTNLAATTLAAANLASTHQMSGGATFQTTGAGSATTGAGSIHYTTATAPTTAAAAAKYTSTTTTTTTNTGGGAMYATTGTALHTTGGAAISSNAGIAAAIRSGDIDPSMFGENCYTHTRKVSNVIVSETLLGQVPQQDEVRYVEADASRFPPEERVTHVIKKETRERVVEKRVPVVEYVERVVEVPRVEYIDRTVEVPQVQEIYVDQRVPQVIDRMVEVVKEVPVQRERVVERVVEVPGGIIEVPKPYPVPVEKEVYRAIETENPVIVAQVVKPIIKESSKQLVVDVMDFEPEVIPVDVHVAKPVSSALELVGTGEVQHRLVNITSAQYNTILRQLNAHVDGKFQMGLPYVRDNGQTLFLKNEQIHYIEAPTDIRIAGYAPKPTMQHQQITTTTTTTGQHMLAAPPVPMEVISRGGQTAASAYTSAVAYQGGCPTNITEAMQVCASGRPQQQQQIKTALPLTGTLAPSSAHHQQSSLHTGAIRSTASTQQYQQPPMVTASYGNTTIEVPRAAVETAQSLLQSTLPPPSANEGFNVTTRDLTPVQTGSEVRTFPGAASLPREGGSIRSQLPAQQSSRICC